MKKAEEFLIRAKPFMPKVFEFVVADQVGDVTTKMISDAFLSMFKQHGLPVSKIDAAISVTDASIFLRIEKDDGDVILQFYVCPENGLVCRVISSDEKPSTLINLDALDPAIDKRLSSVDISDLSWINKSTAALLIKQNLNDEAYMTLTDKQPTDAKSHKSVNQGVLKNDNGHFKKIPTVRKRTAIDKSDVDAYSIVKYLGWRDFKNA